MTYNYHEWTAFREADLLQAGDHSIGYGDCFTMPASATVCLSTWDNDWGLSGDNYCNEHANDQYGQNAYVDGAAIGGKFYAEKYHVLHGSDGCTYYLIEIEVEGHNAAGAGDDYFAFYGTVPPAGVELTVGGSCNITGDWLGYHCLDAGPKEEPNPWVFDEETCTYTIEAEDLTLHGFKVVDGNHASGGELVRIEGCQGKLETEFGGETGVYNLTICVQDECDGHSKLYVYVDGEFMQVVTLDGNNDGYGSDNGGFSAFTLQGLEIPAGANVEIYAQRDGNEFIRVDALKFEEVKFEVCDDPDAVLVDFESFGTGDVLGTQIDGVTISASGGSGQAMIFDSQNPTGGDGDLETQVAQQGNILIVSEDGDSSDPDDVAGGTLVFDFDQPSMVFDLKVIDTEEGGTITLTLADGSTRSFDIPNLVNGGIGQVVMHADDVVRMEVALNGSGAIDDLCFVPGEEPLGSLSGRYFCDDDRDGLDNDGPDNGIAGVSVTLLDANGTPVLDATGQPVTATTDNTGNYSFTGLVPGTYGVLFTDAVSGKVLTAQNVDNDDSDTIDSDATDLGGGQSLISGIIVVAGQDTPDNDAGVFPNDAPLAGDDMGKGCADEFIFIDLLDNDMDPDGDAITVTSISDADETATVGESITLEDGAVVTLNADGTVTVDGIAAYADLEIRQEAMDSFSYSIEDAFGATATANVDVTFCGTLNTVNSIADNFPITGNFGVGGFFIGDAYTGLTLNTGDSRFDGVLIEAAYCIEKNDAIVFQNVDFAVTIYAAVEGAVADAGNGLDNENIDGNLDLINWIINEDFTSQSNGDMTGDGAGLNYTDTEVQAAIWAITDGDLEVQDPGVVSGIWNGSEANAQEILDRALAEGEGYVPGEGDLMTFIVIPDQDQTAQGFTESNDLDQSFIIALPFDQFLEDCIC